MLLQAVQTKYSVKPSDLRAQHEQGMKRVAMNLEAYQRNLDAAVKTLTAQAAKVRLYFQLALLHASPFSLRGTGRAFPCHHVKTACCKCLNGFCHSYVRFTKSWQSVQAAQSHSKHRRPPVYLTSVLMLSAYALDSDLFILVSFLLGC